jgi:hypothetical protein
MLRGRGGDRARSVPWRSSGATGKRNDQAPVAFILTFTLSVDFDFTFDAPPHSFWSDCTDMEGLSGAQASVSGIDLHKGRNHEGSFISTGR